MQNCFVKKCLLILIFFIFACNNQVQKNINENSDMDNVSNKKIHVIDTLDIKGLEKIKKENVGKIIIVNFYASWCPPCREEIPGFVKSYKKLKNNLLIIGLSLDVEDKTAINFINEMGINYPVYKADKTLQRRFNIITIPTSIIYKADGTLYNMHPGYLSSSEIEKLISMLR